MNPNKKEAKEREKTSNKYMEEYRRDFEILTAPPVVPCVFCGKESIPGSDLCGGCDENYEIYQEKQSPETLENRIE